MPLLAGCFVPIPYAYPSVTPINPAFVGRDRNIKVFRVDIDQDLSGTEYGGGDCYTLCETTVTHRGWTLPQTRLACSHGFVWHCVALCYHKHLAHTARLRCYRPGYELAEVEPWQVQGDVAWKKVPDLREQEKAVDDLVAAPVAQSWRVSPSSKMEESWSVGCLAPGSASEWHKEALVFAADEYERLALFRRAMNEREEPNILRLEQKTRQLRDLARGAGSKRPRPGRWHGTCLLEVRQASLPISRSGTGHASLPPTYCKHHP
jgi:hypothetical protein